ncbi:MAG TPA: class I SAM-dependent methyltransferase [Anaerolineaceae bacterium]|nr:class I SAM-dependent methyltransferase [Anaerolineaceae bacterium]
MDDVPVHSVQLVYSREEAIEFPTGQIDLGFCRQCGFIFNIAFDPQLHDYAKEYESTQGFSPTFNSFADRLVDSLITKYDLHAKEILEIGCGQGEFLQLLCEKGGNHGIGFDPAYRPEPSLVPAAVPAKTGHYEVIKDYYSEKYSDISADFYCCRMTLEHIQDTAGFVTMVRNAIGNREDAVVFFQVPDVTRILVEQGFWDIYYEHCSYFSLGSLARLFRRCGFDVVDLWKDYGEQYLMIEARPGDGKGTPLLPAEDDLEELKDQVDAFAGSTPTTLKRWTDLVHSSWEQGKKIVLWGSGSKGVAFLTTLGLRDEIRYTVDINPNKTGTFMAGTGQEVVSPDFCRDYRPDIVIIMNPIYHDEIHALLQQMNVPSDLISLGK